MLLMERCAPALPGAGGPCSVPRVSVPAVHHHSCRSLELHGRQHSRVVYIQAHS